MLIYYVFLILDIRYNEPRRHRPPACNLKLFSSLKFSVEEIMSFKFLQNCMLLEKQMRSMCVIAELSS